MLVSDPRLCRVLRMTPPGQRWLVVVDLDDMAASTGTCAQIATNRSGSPESCLVEAPDEEPVTCAQAT
jgi:hypothetical protein